MAGGNPREHWMRQYGYDQSVQKFREYKDESNGPVGRIIANFCNEWQEVRSVLADWECSYQLAQTLSIPWRVWAMRLREEMKWTERTTQYPAIDFVIFADRLFYQWLSEKMPPYDMEDFRAARDIRIAEAKAAEVRKKAKEDSTIRTSDHPEGSVPVNQVGTHDSEAGSSRARVNNEDPPPVNGRRIRRRVGMRTGGVMEKFCFQIPEVATIGSDTEEEEEEEEEASQMSPISQPGIVIGESIARAREGQSVEEGQITDWIDDELIQLEPPPFARIVPRAE